MRTLGICLGASNVSAVLLEGRSGGDLPPAVARVQIRAHEGNPGRVLREILQELEGKFVRIAVTGRKLRHRVALSSIAEPQAVEVAYGALRGRYGETRSIVSAGGETFMVYRLGPTGRLETVATGNKCASGTGEFFLQQLKRIGLDPAEAVRIADLQNPYKVSGRCSVFCKSDCTHALNKGEPKERVVAGLSEMMANRITELLKDAPAGPVYLIGGTSRNTAMVEYLRRQVGEVVVPEEAAYFETLGAALWALDHETQPYPGPDGVLRTSRSSFSFLPALPDFAGKVSFRERPRGVGKAGDRCVVGLDVGSTTTKAVVVRLEDQAILTSVYLRTSGDPVGASRRCYDALSRDLEAPVRIVGLGVTGSGRQIAGLHALTEAVINEIVAHATAAVYFDPKVDTVFEIGGQDAKYTYIVNRVPADYAMNEACSAGTGSFLEEAAQESLDVATQEIAGIALRGTRPPNFSDQCAAFISSDIKTAIQEGIPPEDIVAGLVYSICQNYANRVKGNRPVGKRIFMQGGVCYNRAVPIAMAALTGREIVVPPEPGLMGAFGVALEVAERLRLGLLTEKEFDLRELAARDLAYDKPFVCRGGAERCDRRCRVAMVRIEGKRYPFGGACNKYANLTHRVACQTDQLDLVARREELLFGKRGRRLVAAAGAEIAAAGAGAPPRTRVGISRGLMTNSFFPLYAGFFEGLGLEVVVPDDCDIEGMERKGAAFCYPAEQAHGYLRNLLQKDPDCVFLPHVKGLWVEHRDAAAENPPETSVTCPFVQGEPYYLRTAFPELRRAKLLSPVLDFGRGFEKVVPAFVRVGRAVGKSARESRRAFGAALASLQERQREMQELGRRALRELEADPSRTAVVLFGRPYNALSSHGNLGIPRKFASRGYLVIPFDFLPYTSEAVDPRMYWSTGQMILKAARFVRNHPQLFGVYVTNFSCGPDSFLVGYFRQAMGNKPSLTLELDSHTADAGIDTRVEAFLDVVKSFRQLGPTRATAAKREFSPARVELQDNGATVVTSDNRRLPLTDPRVQVLVPSMGDEAAHLMAATLEYSGVRAAALDAPAEEDLNAGRGRASCKECLPLILTLGSLFSYLRRRRESDDGGWPAGDEVLVYFMPEASGPCRFGQYSTLIANAIQREEIANVAQLSLSSDDGYAGLGSRFALRAWQALIISDTMDEIRAALLVLAANRQQALETYRRVYRRLVESVRVDDWPRLRRTLEEVAARLAAITLRGSPEETPTVALVGEIYVRRDSFSRQWLVERLAEKGILTRVAPVNEWLYYADYVLMHNLDRRSTAGEKTTTVINGFFRRKYDRLIKGIMARSGLCQARRVDIAREVNRVRHLLPPDLTGEAILTLAGTISGLVDEVAGAIAIGPFGCMPNRIAEAITGASLDEEKRSQADPHGVIRRVIDEHPHLPFLSIETDGNVFPQIVEARLETFVLQVQRVAASMRQARRESAAGGPGDRRRK